MFPKVQMDFFSSSIMARRKAGPFFGTAGSDPQAPNRAGTSSVATNRFALPRPVPVRHLDAQSAVPQFDWEVELTERGEIRERRAVRGRRKTGTGNAPRSARPPRHRTGPELRQSQSIGLLFLVPSPFGTWTPNPPSLNSTGKSN